VERRRIGPIQLFGGWIERGARTLKPSRIDLVVLISRAHRKLLEIGCPESWIANCNEGQCAPQRPFSVNLRSESVGANMDSSMP
jgi:hypothetical protein